MRGEDVHRRGIGSDGGGVDPRFGLVGGVVVEEITGLKIVGGIEDDLCGGEELVDVSGDEIGYIGVDLDRGVEESDLAARSFGFGKGFESVLFVKKNLALKVRGFDEVTVDEGEGTDSRAGEKRGGCCACRSAAYDGGVGVS